METTQLAVLKAEIAYQVEAIEQVLKKIRSRQQEDLHEERNIESLGYQIHNLYCAFEDLFKSVAKFFENNVDDLPRYHSELLQRMTLNIEGVRPALVTPELRQALDELRAFRHVFRHAYSYELDPEKIRLLLKKVGFIEQTYKKAIDRFLTLLAPQ
jgi:uncharacterized protein YutE (UPF0331/DUF86 family)